MSDFLGDWHALLVLLIAGFLPNEVWRMIGLWLGAGVDEGSDLLVWVRAVATAILAGVIAQISAGRLGQRAGWVALWRSRRRIHRLHGDPTVHLCWRGLRRTPDACRQMVAWLIGASSRAV